MSYFFPLIGFIFTFISLIILSILSIQNRNIPIFKLIFLGQFFLFSLIFSMMIFSLLDSNISNDLPVFIHRMGMLSGHFGAITWFFIFDRIENEYLGIKRIFLQRSLVFLIGLSYAVNFLTIKYSFSDSWQITYEPVGIGLLVLVYGSFTIYQYILFFRRVRNYIHLKKFPKITAIMYFVVMMLSLISFVLGRPIFSLPFLWILFGGIAQFFLTYLLVTIPRVLLTNEEPILTLILSSGGNAIYVKSFDEERDMEKDLVGGFLTAIDIFGKRVLDQKGTFESINYNYHTILLKTIKGLRFSYMFKGASYYAPVRLKQFIDLLMTDQALWKKFISSKGFLSRLEDDEIEKIDEYSSRVFV